MKPHPVIRILTLAGAAGFLAIVIYLHRIQSGYSPADQLMSELALGEQGWLMLYAFLLLALSVAGAAGLLASCAAPRSIPFLLAAASVFLAGAGIFTLGTATALHVALVALAFVLLVLAMYLAPRHVPALRNVQGRAACWGLGLGTALAVALGGNALPIGIAQRLAAGCLLIWMCWLALYVPRLTTRGTRA